MTASAFLSLAAVLAFAPALPGIATRTRAFLTGRRGAPVTQLYRDLAKLLRKGEVVSPATTAVFAAAPLAGLVTTLAAALLLPLDGRAAPFALAGDMALFVGLLALGRFLLVLAGLDTASSFEGMGASREATFATFTEPAIFLAFVALALATGRGTLSGMLGTPLAEAWPHASASLALVAAGLFLVLLAEASRVPVDDPATHLELTMIHEVIVLDHSGPDLAALLYASALKFALFASLVVTVLVPRSGLNPWVSIAALLAGMAAVAAAAGVVESLVARLQLPRVPQFLVSASILPLFGIILLVS